MKQHDSDSVSLLLALQQQGGIAPISAMAGPAIPLPQPAGNFDMKPPTQPRRPRQPSGSWMELVNSSGGNTQIAQPAGIHQNSMITGAEEDHSQFL